MEQDAIRNMAPPFPYNPRFTVFEKSMFSIICYAYE